MQIVSNPERVCLEHALEFWTGLLVYAKDHSDPCVSHEGRLSVRAIPADNGGCTGAEHRLIDAARLG
jgi:hypothetical protein